MFKKSESEIDDQPKFADLLSNGRGLLTLTLIVAIGSHAINIFAVRTVLPTIVADIGGAKILFWSTALFSLMAILGGMLTINIKSRIGARQSFYLAAILLVIGSAFGGFAPYSRSSLSAAAFKALPKVFWCPSPIWCWQIPIRVI